jgi:hypothetical protein
MSYVLYAVQHINRLGFVAYRLRTSWWWKWGPKLHLYLCCSPFPSSPALSSALAHSQNHSVVLNSYRKSLQSVLITALGFSSIDVGLQQQLSRWRLSEILLNWAPHPKPVVSLCFSSLCRNEWIHRLCEPKKTKKRPKNQNANTSQHAKPKSLHLLPKVASRNYIAIIIDFFHPITPAWTCCSWIDVWFFLPLAAIQSSYLAHTSPPTAFKGFKTSRTSYLLLIGQPESVKGPR